MVVRQSTPIPAPAAWRFADTHLAAAAGWSLWQAGSRCKGDRSRATMRKAIAAPALVTGLTLDSISGGRAGNVGTAHRFYTLERTTSSASRMSAKCHKPT
jgi:hypothetical protein